MYLFILIIIICLIIFVAFLTAPRLSGRERVLPFFGVKWAHRGLHDMRKNIPENSMAAFRAAIREGCGIELDVHLSRDGRLVVFHDDTFDRVCNVSGVVEQTDYSTMKEYRLNGTDERIPLFSDVLRCVNGQVPLLIEVKLPSADTEICSRLAEELAEYKGNYMIQSFNSLVLRWMKKHKGDIPRGQLSSNLTASDDNPHYLLRFCVKYLLSNFLGRPDFISYKWADRRNPGFWLNRVVFRAPSAVWTLHGKQAVREAQRKFDMYIFEVQ